jgi:hypothetical protein
MLRNDTSITLVGWHTLDTAQQPALAKHYEFLTSQQGRTLTRVKFAKEICMRDQKATRPWTTIASIGLLFLLLRADVLINSKKLFLCKITHQVDARKLRRRRK